MLVLNTYDSASGAGPAAGKLTQQESFRLDNGISSSGGTCSFVETGADYGFDCHWDSTGEDCEVHSQEAYYVAASKNGGGESPRSEIVFWNCNPATGPEGNAYAIPDSRFPWSDGNGAALASAAEPAEPGVCPDLVEGQLDRHPNSSELNVVESASKLRRREIAPLLTLGTVDPPYQILDLHVDHLGSVRAITDESGAIVSSHDFFPFGEELTPIVDPYNKKMFTGHERDKTTGTDYMLARHYGTNLGRFMSTDPIPGSPTDPTSWNLYSYVRNSPLNFFAPLGLHWAPGTSPPDSARDPQSGRCYLCVQVEPASDSDEDKEKAETMEQDVWTFYQEHQAAIEAVYGAWGVSPDKLKRWFTPGKGPKVKAKNDLRVEGRKVNGWFSPRWAIRVDNDLGSTAVHTLIHEMIHKVQHRRGDTPEGTFASSGEAIRYAALRTAHAIKVNPDTQVRNEFMAYWATRVLVGAN